MMKYVAMFNLLLVRSGGGKYNPWYQTGETSMVQTLIEARNLEEARETANSLKAYLEKYNSESPMKSLSIEWELVDVCTLENAKVWTKKEIDDLKTFLTKQYTLEDVVNPKDLEMENE